MVQGFIALSLSNANDEVEDEDEEREEKKRGASYSLMTSKGYKYHLIPKKYGRGNLYNMP